MDRMRGSIPVSAVEEAASSAAVGRSDLATADRVV